MKVYGSDKLADAIQAALHALKGISPLEIVKEIWVRLSDEEKLLFKEWVNF